MILKLSLIYSCVIFLSDKDSPPPWERNVLTDVNGMTLSLEHLCTEDVERVEYHSPLTIDCQYNESSGAEWKISGMTNNTTLENLHCDETAMEQFHLNTGQANER